MVAEQPLRVTLSSLVAASMAAAALWGCFADKPAPEKPPPIVDKRAPQQPPVVDVSVFEPAAASEPVAEEPEISAQDAEPNDRPEQAIAVTPGRPLRGVIGRPADPKGRTGDQDWYVLTVAGDTPMLGRAELSGADDLDVVLEYVSPKPRRRGKYRAIVQADVQVKRPGPEVLPSLNLGPGKHYFRVREAWYRNKRRTGSAKPYRLRITLRPWIEGADAEPNDADPDALKTELDVGGQGLIGHVGDRDLWAVHLPPSAAGGRVRVTITPIPGLEMTAAVRFEPHGEFGKSSHGDAGKTLILRNIGVPPPGSKAEQAPPPLFVQVGTRRGASVESRYSVFVGMESAGPQGGLVEREPNDGPDGSTRVEAPDGPGEVLIHGFLDHRRDVDVYEFTVNGPMSLGAMLTPPMGADYAFNLRGPEGIALSAKRTKAGQSEIMRGVGLLKGSWRLMVRRQRGETNAKAAYALKLEFGDGDRSEAEPNDAFSSTRVSPLPASGQPARGCIHPAGDRDLWLVDLTKATEGRIATFKVKAPPGLLLKAALYAADESVLTIAERLSDESTFTHYLEPGAYRLRVWGVDKSATEAQTPYEISLLE